MVELVGLRCSCFGSCGFLSAISYHTSAHLRRGRLANERLARSPHANVAELEPEKPAFPETRPPAVLELPVRGVAAPLLVGRRGLVDAVAHERDGVVDA